MVSVALGVAWLIAGGAWLAAGSTVALVGAAVLGATTAGRAERRLRDLEHVAAAAANGNIESRVADATDDRIGALARSVDAVVGQLEQSEHRRRAIERLHHYESLHDELTGLPNRRGAAEKLAERRTGRGASVLVVDVGEIDGLARRLGHVVADEVVLGVAGRLQLAVLEVACRPIVARWSPGRFAVVLAGARPDEIAQARDHIDASLLEPLQTSAGPIRVRAGVEATASSRCGTAGELVAAAEASRLDALRRTGERELARSRAASN